MEATLTGCQKKMEAKPCLCLGLEPEVVQILIRKALSEHGHHNFVGIRQAAIYALMYYLTARFEEVKVLELRQLCTKGASLEVQIFKGKRNQKRKLQRCVIHPISSSSQGQTCPVYLLNKYLAHRSSLGHNGENDLIFPLVGAKWQRVRPSYFVDIRLPIEPMSYDVYRKHLKRHLDGKALRELGVYPVDYSTHSFRKGGLSMLADGEMHPAFIQKSARHKSWESSVTYIEASLSKALKANDLLSGNDPSEGWGSRYSGNPKSLSCFLPEKFIKDLPSEAGTSLERSNSETSSFSGSSSVQEDLSFRNTSQTSGQSSGGMEMESEDAEVTTSATAPPASPTLDLNLDALDALRISGAIEVTYLAGWQKN